jgi:Protein of unknown function (DUF3224)
VLKNGFEKRRLMMGNCRTLSSMRFVLPLALAAALFSTIALAQKKEIPMTRHAHGTFTVKVEPLTPPPAEGLSRYSIDKQIHGDLEAASKGEMFAGGDPKKGAAGYVAIEVVTGTLEGKHGSFALEHMATIDQSGPKMQIVVVPGSGTGELEGIAGTFTITIEKGQHSYDMDYTLPE